MEVKCNYCGVMTLPGAKCRKCSRLVKVYVEEESFPICSACGYTVEDCTCCPICDQEICVCDKNEENEENEECENCDEDCNCTVEGD